MNEINAAPVAPVVFLGLSAPVTGADIGPCFPSMEKAVAKTPYISTLLQSFLKTKMTGADWSKLVQGSGVDSRVLRLLRAPEGFVINPKRTTGASTQPNLPTGAA
jgi:hypothetical protein